MVERVKTAPEGRPKFPGSDTPIAPISEQRLIPRDEDDDDEDAEAAPKYERLDQGPQVGVDPEKQAEARAATQELAEKLDADDVVPCIFPREVRLQEGGFMHIWGPGVHMVPVSIGGRSPKERHWWLKRNKVRHAGKVQKNPNKDAHDTEADESDEAAA